MDYHVEPALLATLQAAAQGARGALRATQLLAVAWHLRQRDGREALRLADEAEALLTRSGSAAERRRHAWRLALLRCEVGALSCEFDAAQGQLDLAWRLLREAGADSPLEQGDSWLAAAALAKSRGQRRQEMAAYAEAVKAYAQGKDPARLQSARACLAYEQTFNDPAADDLQPEAASTSTPAVLAYRLAGRGLRLSRQEPAASAEAWLAGSRHAQRVGLIRLAIVCQANAGSALHALGDLEGAAACYALAERAARAAGWPALRGVVQTRMGSYLTDLGRMDEALLELRAAVAALAAAPATINRANACSELAISLVRMGRAVEAEELMAEAIRVYRLNDSTDNLALNLIHQARLLGQLGRVEAARAVNREAMALTEQHGLKALRTQWHEIEAELCRREEPAQPPPAGWPSWALWHGEAAMREGAALSGWRAPVALRVGLAQGWAAQGGTAAALGHALAALQDQGAELARAQQLLNAQAPLPRSEAPPELDEEGYWRPPVLAAAAALQRLTPKEREVLSLLARGYTNKEIAIGLELGLETVKWYLKRLFAKLQATNRRHAVARARTLGLA